MKGEELELHNAVIHQLSKDGASPSIIMLAEDSLDVSQTDLVGLVSDVHGVYGSRAGKRYCEFDPEITQFSIEPHLESFRDGQVDFYSASTSIMNVLKVHADAQNFATGGYVLIFDYSANDHRWFVVAVVNAAAGTMVDESFKVVQAPHLDTNGVRFAGRVNFDGWANGEERYVSFLSGKTTEVSQYFQKVLGCSNISSDLSDTKNLVLAVKKFAADKGLDAHQKELLLSSIHHHAGIKAAEREPLSLDTLANQVWPDDPDALRLAFSESDPPISDGFVPQKRGLSPLVRFKTGAQKWKLEFDRDAIQDETIYFDDEQQTITIRQLPVDVLERLREEFSENEGT